MLPYRSKARVFSTCFISGQAGSRSFQGSVSLHRLRPFTPSGSEAIKDVSSWREGEDSHHKGTSQFLCDLLRVSLHPRPPSEGGCRFGMSTLEVFHGRSWPVLTAGVFFFFSSFLSFGANFLAASMEGFISPEAPRHLNLLLVQRGRTPVWGCDGSS